MLDPRHTLRRAILPALLLVAGLPLAAPASHASWPYVPQEVRLAEADDVLVAKVRKRGRSVERRGGTYRIWILEPIEWLKGGPARGKIRLARPVRTDLPEPQVGEQSIWVLRFDEGLSAYLADYPTDRQPLDRLAEIRGRLTTVAGIVWSEPRNGLQLGALVEQRDKRDLAVVVEGQPVPSLAQVAVYPLMRNVGDDPIHVSTFPRDRPFSILLRAPSGRMIDVTTYPGAPAGASEPSRRDVVRLPPGRVRSVTLGFLLPPLTENGEHAMRLRYKSERELPEPDELWSGRVATPEIRWHVPSGVEK